MIGFGHYLHRCACARQTGNGPLTLCTVLSSIYPVGACTASRRHPQTKVGEISFLREDHGGLSEIAVNASLAFIENAKPKDEVESALLVQMACTHTAAMSVLATFAGGHSYGRDVPMKASAAARLMRAYATQVETLRRLRNGGSQVVRVEHVHVNEGGQALIGNVRKDGSGGESEK